MTSFFTFCEPSFLWMTSTPLCGIAFHCRLRTNRAMTSKMMDRAKNSGYSSTAAFILPAPTLGMRLRSKSTSSAAIKTPAAYVPQKPHRTASP